MVKPLSFKGDKKTKKRKRVNENEKRGEELTSRDFANAEEQQPVDDDTWVTAEGIGDVVGPIIFVLPSDPPTCLACDANGKVFASTVENTIDNDPSTAEPHDVRQVWIASKVVGTDTFTFKGHHGKYLSCDKFGMLSAGAEAVSHLESFRSIPTADTTGAFLIQTLQDKYLTIKESKSTAAKPEATPEIRADAETITFNTTLRIRLQARFKPKLKASKEEKAKERISRKELEETAGRRLEDDEVKRLKRARREGDYHEAMLLIKAKNKHDKYS